MKKKVLSMLLIMTMVLAMFVPGVSAADVWKTNVGAVGSPWGSVPDTYYVTNDAFHSGSVSLFVNGDGTNDTLNMIQYIGAPDTNSNYTLTFYAKEANESNLSDSAGLFWSWNIQVRYSTQDKVQHLNAGGFTATQESDGWWKYTATYKPNAGDSNLHIIFNRGRNDIPIYIDDISLVKEGTTTNLVKNGGFEEYEVPKPTITADPGDRQVSVNWTNPAIASTAISMTVNGEAVVLDSVNLAANAANTKTITGLTNKETYEITVTCTTSSGAFSDTTYVIPRALEVGTANGWNSGSGYFTVTTEESKNGIASLHAAIPANSGNKEITWNVGTVDTSATYTISFYAKILKGNKWDYQVQLGGWQSWNLDSYNKTTETGNFWTTVEDAGNGWMKYTKTDYVPAAGDTNLHICANNDTEKDAYFDNIVIIKNGDSTNENLIGNGDFEKYTAFKPSLSAAFGDSEITVSWTNPAIASTAISMTVNGEAVALDSVDLAANAANTKTVTGLANGVPCEVVVTCKTAFGDFAETATVTPRELKNGTATHWSIEKSQYFYSTTEDSAVNLAALKIAVPQGTIVSGSPIELTQAVEIETGATYTVSFYAKILKGNKWDYQVQLGGWQSWNLDSYNKTTETGNFWTTVEDAGNGWMKYTKTDYEPAAGDTNLHIVLSEPGEKLAYIDDIKIIKNGDETNTNIVTNGDFEEFKLLTDAAAYGYCDSYGYLCWSVIGAADYFNIYKLNGEERTLIGATSNGTANYYAVEGGISAGDKFVVTTVNGTKESDGIVIREGVNAYPVFAIGTVDGDGKVSVTEELTAIQGGNIIAGAKLATSSAEKVYYDMFVALYNGDTVEQVIKLDTKSISESDLMTTTATTINIPEIGEDDDYSIGVMIWEDETLKPLSERFELR